MVRILVYSFKVSRDKIQVSRLKMIYMMEMNFCFAFNSLFVNPKLQTQNSFKSHISSLTSPLFRP